MQTTHKYTFSVLLLVAICSVPLESVNAQDLPTPCPYTWTRNLRIGSNGDDVLKLQQFLNSLPNMQIAVSGIGSSGNESKDFGPKTEQAVAKLQEKYAADILSPLHLTKGTGSVGAVTRAKMNALCAATLATTTVTQLTSQDPDILTVKSTTQPKSTLAPAGAGGVPFTSVMLTAGSKDVTINSITAERTGASVDQVFDSIALNDENGDEIGDDNHFKSNHQTIFSEPFTVPAHTSKTLTIVGNMAGDLTSYGGEMPVIQIDSIDASSNIDGVFPLRGTAQTVNSSLTIGGATAILSQYDPDTNTNHFINDSGIHFSGIRITANSQEDLSLSSIAWDQSGTASDSDFTNITTVVNGISYPTEVSGHSYTSNFSPNIIIPKGQSADVYIQGDITATGSNRTIKFDISGSDDISLTGNTFGYGVGIAAGSNTAVSGNSVFTTSDGTTGGSEGVPFFSGSVVTINAGTPISIQKAN